MTSKRKKSGKRRGNPAIAELGKPFRWRPGRSANPGGRPSKTPYADAHRIVADLKVAELAIRKTDRVALAIAKRTARSAARGKISAAVECANRCEGTPRERVQVAEQGSREITIHVVYDAAAKNPAATRAARKLEFIPEEP